MLGNYGNVTEMGRMQSALQQISGWVRSGSLQACLAEQSVLIDKSQHCSCRNNFVSWEKRLESPGKMCAFQFRSEQRGSQARDSLDQTPNKCISHGFCPWGNYLLIIMEPTLTPWNPVSHWDSKSVMQILTEFIWVPKQQQIWYELCETLLFPSDVKVGVVKGPVG